MNEKQHKRRTPGPWGAGERLKGMWEGDSAFMWGREGRGTVIRASGRAANGGLQGKGSGILVGTVNAEVRVCVGGNVNETWVAVDREGHTQGGAGHTGLITGQGVAC